MVKFAQIRDIICIIVRPILLKKNTALLAQKGIILVRKLTDLAHEMASRSTSAKRHPDVTVSGIIPQIRVQFGEPSSCAKRGAELGLPAAINVAPKHLRPYDVLQVLRTEGYRRKLHAPSKTGWSSTFFFSFCFFLDSVYCPSYVKL